MAVVAMSATQSVGEEEALLDLSVALSRLLTNRHPEGPGAAVGLVLDGVARATGVDNCQFLDFSESGLAPSVRLRRQATETPDGRIHAPLLEPWLVDRLNRGELVAISHPDDLPREATARREQTRRGGSCALLAVPAVFEGRTICALVIDSTPHARRWPSSLTERLRLSLEILGGALLRERTEKALLANNVLIERLNAQLAADNVYLKEEIKQHHDFEDIVGESQALRVALARVNHVAPTGANVLLLGPTGCGKELFARAVHERSQRRARPLIRVNCAALPPALIESELFGHEKGAFTGAVAMRQGRFELADGGTIFLDEIGDLPKDVQVKFLRVLQEGEFERVGSSRPRKVDARIIAATHRDLEAAVADGSFRADLYYRLNVYPIRLPSLHERVEDIPRLVWFFIHRHNLELGRRVTRVPQEVMDALQRHAWPGNVRELENVIERAMIASTGDTLQLDEPATVAPRAGNGDRGSDPGTLDAVQRAHIEAVLEQCGWRINGAGNAAERLGVHPNTLRFRMKKLGLWGPGGRERPHPPSTRTP